MIRRPPRSTLFPYTNALPIYDTYNANPASLRWAVKLAHWLAERRRRPLAVVVGSMLELGPERDRESTRLNSSHSQISYAVFCLKQKKRAYHLSAITYKHKTHH